MPRGKNYVNNNKGVRLLPSRKAKATSIIPCQYGSGCTRPDCIYRHEPTGKADDVCLPFLAGKCAFPDQGCRKRHPDKQETERLIAKYKRTRCRFGEECRTDGCLYLHPNEMEAIEPAYLEPHHVAFPPLNGASTKKPPVNSAWKQAPPAVRTSTETLPSSAPTWSPPIQCPPIPPESHGIPSGPPNWCPPPPPESYDMSYYPSNWVPQPHAGGYEMPYYPAPHHGGMDYSAVPYYPENPPSGSLAASFNVNAKEFVPGGNWTTA